MEMIWWIPPVIISARALPSTFPLFATEGSGTKSYLGSVVVTIDQCDDADHHCDDDDDHCDDDDDYVDKEQGNLVITYLPR